MDFKTVRRQHEAIGNVSVSESDNGVMEIKIESKQFGGQSMTRTVFATIILIILSGGMLRTAAAADGNELLRNCRAAIEVVEAADAGRSIADRDFIHMRGMACSAYIRGTIDSNVQFLRYLALLSEVLEADGSKLGLFCFPQTGSYEQAIRIVVKFLTDHPESLHKADYSLVIDALFDAYPCQ